MSPPRPMLSVVLPCLDEAGNLRPLVERLVPVLERTCAGRFEVIFVDDGSTDDTPRLLEEAQAGDARIKSLSLSRNFGHQAALTAGLEHAQGEAVVLMDADLQDPPELVERFVAKWREGHEVVYAIRQKRKEGLLLRAAYSVFYRSMRALAEIDVPLDAGDFCLLDRKVVRALNDLREKNRFLRGLRAWVGFRQAGVAYERQARHAGPPKYTLRKLVRLALAGYLGFSTMPLRLATWLGFGASIAGFGLAAWAVTMKLLDPRTPLGWTSTMAVVLFMGGVQLLVIGVAGEYLGRVYDEVRGRPVYLVRERRGLPDDG
jgi:glycosyltransferase involved in cell wall biosynthesis